MTDVATLKDAALVKLAQAGDSEAFGQLVERYENKVYRLARRMSETQEDAEDILQDAFVRAFRSISSFEGRSTFSTWLYRITMNLALMKIRSRKRDVDSLDEPITTRDGEIKRDLEDGGRDPLDQLILKESREILDKAMDGLYPHNRAVFVLRHLDGLSTEETAEVLNISLATVKSRLHRTRLALRRRLRRLARDEAMAACTS